MKIFIKRKERLVLLLLGLCAALMVSSSLVVYCDRCPTCGAAGLMIGKVPTMGAQYVIFYHDTKHFWWCAYVDGKLKTEAIHIQ